MTTEVFGRIDLDEDGWDTVFEDRAYGFTVLRFEGQCYCASDSFLWQCDGPWEVEYEDFRDDCDGCGVGSDEVPLTRNSDRWTLAECDRMGVLPHAFGCSECNEATDAEGGAQ